MVDDSIYGMPTPPSPTAHQQLAEQLQERQLQPIAEEHTPSVSPESAGKPYSSPSSTPGAPAAGFAPRPGAEGLLSAFHEAAAQAVVQQHGMRANTAGQEAAGPNPASPGSTSDTTERGASRMAARRPQPLLLPSASRAAAASSNGGCGNAAAATAAQLLDSPAAMEVPRQAPNPMGSPAARPGLPGSSSTCHLTTQGGLTSSSCAGSGPYSPAKGTSTSSSRGSDSPGSSKSQHNLEAAVTGARGQGSKPIVHQLLAQGEQLLNRMSTFRTASKQEAAPAGKSDQQQCQHTQQLRCLVDAAAGADHQQGPTAASSAGDLVSALQRLTGDSRQGSIERAPTPAHAAAQQQHRAQQLHSPQQQLHQHPAVLSPGRAGTAAAAKATAGAAAGSTAAAAAAVGPQAVNSSIGTLIHALRRATAENIHSTTDAQKLPAAAAKHNQQHHQMSGVAAGVHHINSGNSSSSVEELLGMLRRATGDSRRSTAEVAASPTTSLHGQHAAPALNHQPQRQLRQEETAGRPQAGMPGSCSTVDELMQVLGGVTTDGSSHAVSAVAATTTATAAGAQGQHTPQQPQQQQLGLHSAGGQSGAMGSCSSTDALVSALCRVTSDGRASTTEGVATYTTPVEAPAGGRLSSVCQQITVQQQSVVRRQQQQALHHWRDAEAGNPDVRASSVQELILALRRATGDSRRTTGDSLPSTPSNKATAASIADVDSQGWQQQQQQMAETGPIQRCRLDRFSGANELIGALHGSTQDSRRGTAESLPGTPSTNRCAAAAAAAESGHQPGSLFGSLSSVDELIRALRRATSGSRRATAESVPGSPLAVVAAAAAKQPALAHQQQYVQDDGADKIIGTLRRAASNDRSASDVKAVTPAAAAAAAQVLDTSEQHHRHHRDSSGNFQAPEPSSLFGSFSNVGELINALRRVTGDTRCDTAESLPDAPEAYTADTAAACTSKQLKAWDGAAAGVAAGPVAGQQSLFGSIGSVDELILALRRATGDSRRDTAEAVVDVGRLEAPDSGDDSSSQPQQQQDMVQSPDCSSLEGTAGGFDELLWALRRVTAGSRTSTAEAVAEAATVPLSQSQSSDQQQQQRLAQPLQDGLWSSAAGRASEHLDKLVSALRAPTAAADGQQQQWQELTAAPTAAASPAALPAATAAGDPGLDALAAALHRIVAAQCSSIAPGCGTLLLQQQKQQHCDTGRSSPWREQLLPEGTDGNSSSSACRGDEAEIHDLQHAAGTAAGIYEQSPAPATSAPAGPTCRQIHTVTAAVAAAAATAGTAMQPKELLGGCDHQAKQQLVSCPQQDVSASQPHRGESSREGGIGEPNVHLRYNMGDSGKGTTQTVAAAAAKGPLAAQWQQERRQQTKQQQRQQQLAAIEPDKPATLQETQGTQHALGDCIGGVGSTSHVLQASKNAAANQHEPAASNREAASAHHAEGAAAAAVAAAYSACSSTAADPVPSCGLYKFPTSTLPEEADSTGQLPPAPEAETVLAVDRKDKSRHSSAHVAANGHADGRQEAVSCGLPVQPQGLAATEPPATGDVRALNSHNPVEQACTAASQPWSMPCIAAVFDPQLPSGLREQLAAALASAGGTVLPGRPHLSCGANTVIAEPGRASQWVQLLMHVVSPSWLLKACRQQQHPTWMQQLIHVSPDIAKALGQGMQQETTGDAGLQTSGCSSGAEQLVQQHGSRTGSKTSSSSSSKGLRSEEREHPVPLDRGSERGGVPVLLLPPGGLHAGGYGEPGNGWLGATAVGDATTISGQHKPVLMPPGLLEGVVWSVDQDSR